MHGDRYINTAHLVSRGSEKFMGRRSCRYQLNETVFPALWLFFLSATILPLIRLQQQETKGE